MSDLVKIARTYVPFQTTHFDGCEREHIECLVQRMADEIERLRAALSAAMEIVQEDRAAFELANIWPDGRMDNDDGDVLRRYDAVIAQADAALGGE